MGVGWLFALQEHNKGLSQKYCIFLATSKPPSSYHPNHFVVFFSWYVTATPSYFNVLYFSRYLKATLIPPPKSMCCIFHANLKQLLFKKVLYFYSYFKATLILPLCCKFPCISKPLFPISMSCQIK